MYLNKVQLIGNLTRDPELKALPSGSKVCNFSIATNEVYYDKDKKKVESVEFHNVVAFNKTAENVAQFMKKGSQVYVEGKLHTRSWDDKDSGKKLYRTEITAERVQFGNKPAGSSAAAPAHEDHHDQSLDQQFPDEDQSQGGADDTSDIPF